MVRHAMTTIIGLLASIGGTTALAGHGDLEASYGQDGRLTADTIFHDRTVRPASDFLMALEPSVDRLLFFKEGLVLRFYPEPLDLAFRINGETMPRLPAAAPYLNVLLNPAPTNDQDQEVREIFLVFV